MVSSCLDSDRSGQPRRWHPVRRVGLFLQRSFLSAPCAPTLPFSSSSSAWISLSYSSASATCTALEALRLQKSSKPEASLDCWHHLWHGIMQRRGFLMIRTGIDPSRVLWLSKNYTDRYFSFFLVPVINFPWSATAREMRSAKGEKANVWAVAILLEVRGGHWPIWLRVYFFSYAKLHSRQHFKLKLGYDSVDGMMLAIDL